jgi:hypothetical protein
MNEINNVDKRIYILIISVLTACIGCKKPYNPQIIAMPGNYLVVEGVINSSSDSTIIKLSRTVNLTNKIATNPESQAAVTVESDQNTIYSLSETTSGQYVSAGLNLDNTHKYRLRIKTANNKEYVSDFVPVVNSPAIDSVNFKIKNNGVNIYANTHDPNNSTRYYRWGYNETWIFHSKFESRFKSNGDTVLGRDLINDNIYRCWQSDISSTIVLGSSAKLTQDVIVNSPITFISSTSEKVSNEYSIYVKQYALTKDAYNFYVNLKKNTEQLGSIFDAQPSQINGNIHSVTNPSEPVIGYISVGSTTSQRIFIKSQALPAWATTPAYPDCMLAKNCCYYSFRDQDFGPFYNQVNLFINYNKGAGQFAPPLIPVNAISVPGQPPIGYTAADRECVDCTLRGTNKQPAFWK